MISNCHLLSCPMLRIIVGYDILIGIKRKHPLFQFSTRIYHDFAAFDFDFLGNGLTIEIQKRGTKR